MGTLRVIAIIVLAAVICCGTIIKIYTRSRLRDLEGTYDTEPPGHRPKKEA